MDFFSLVMDLNHFIDIKAGFDLFFIRENLDLCPEAFNAFDFFAAKLNGFGAWKVLNFIDLRSLADKKIEGFFIGFFHTEETFNTRRITSEGHKVCAIESWDIRRVSFCLFLCVSRSLLCINCHTAIWWRHIKRAKTTDCGICRSSSRWGNGEKNTAKSVFQKADSLVNCQGRICFPFELHMVKLPVLLFLRFLFSDRKIFSFFDAEI